MLSRIRINRFTANPLVGPNHRRSLHKRNMASTANFKFAAIQLAVTSDKTKTLDHARQKIREAAKNGAQVISLPECFNCPYGTKYFPQYCEPIPNGPTTQMLAEEAKANKVFLIGGSFPEKDGDKLYNTSLSFSPDGSIIGKHRKVHLFDIDIPGKMTFKESESLSAGNSVTVLDTPFCRIGVAICYDVRFAELSMIMAQQYGCKMLVFPGAFNMTTGPLHWELLLRARAVDNQCFVAGVSPARDTSADYIAWGHSAIINPWAEVISKADEKESIIYADIDFQRLDDMRNGIPVTKQKRTDMYSLIDKTKSSS